MRTALVRLAFLLVASGCGRGREVAPPPPETAAPAAPTGKSTVIGTVAAAADGLVSIVLLEPKNSPALSGVEGRTIDTAPEPKMMDQFGQAFSPTLLVSMSGQPVEFRNSEDTLHNIRVYHVESKEPAFNISLPQGGKYMFTFDRTGFYSVSCDIHPAMAADILVASTPFNTVADAEGRFTFQNVPPGPYKLVVIRGGTRSERDVVVAVPKTEIGPQL